MSEFTVGSTRVVPVVELEKPVLDPLVLFPDCTQEILDAESWLVPRYYSREEGLIMFSSQTFLVRSHGKNVVIDTCIGDCKNRVRLSYHQLRSGWLDRFGAVCRPEDVDIVVCTHLHVDHVGWNTVLRDGRWIPTFPNARYLFTGPDYDFYRGPAAAADYVQHGDYFSDSVQPIIDAGLCDIVPVDHRIDDGLSLFHTPGHTPGHVSVRLADGGEEAVFLGDLVHHPLQLRYPDWSTGSCKDPDAARQSRKSLFEQVADTPVLLFPAHFPSPTACHILRADVGYDFHFVGEDRPVLASLL